MKKIAQWVKTRFPGNYPKIDVFYKGKYQHSTNAFKTCKEAEENFINKEKISDSDKKYVKAGINKTR